MIMTKRNLTGSLATVVADQLSWNMSENHWLTQRVEELETENLCLTEEVFTLTKKVNKLEDRIEELTNSHQGLLLSGAYAEIDRLKAKCNLLNRLKGDKHNNEY